MALEKESLAKELDGRVKIDRARGRRNYYAAYATSLFALTVSIFTSISVAIGWFPKGLTAILAALPALAVGLTAVFKFEVKSDWWFARADKFDALRRALLYEGVAESEASRDMSDFIAKHIARWPTFGKPPTSEPKTGDNVIPNRRT